MILYYKHLGKDMNLIKETRYGKMIYNTKDIWVGKSFEKYSEFSELEVQLFRDCLKEGDSAIDVGANIGSHTIAFSQIVGKSGMVLAFEPERINFNTLCGNVAINNIRNIYCFQNAVGSKLGTIPVPELNIEKTENFGSLSLTKDYSTAHHYTVPMTTLDSFGLSRVNFIKVDVEGMEIDVISGSLNTIDRCKPILYLENDRIENAMELINLVNSLGYIVYSHNPSLFNPDNFAKEKENVFLTDSGAHIVSINLFCHHKNIDCPIDIKKLNVKKIN